MAPIRRLGETSRAEAGSSPSPALAPASLRNRIDRAAINGRCRSHRARFRGFPAAHRAQHCSTNLLDRLNKEIKRRSDVACSVASLSTTERSRRHCPVGAILLEQNDEWATTRRYMSLETSARSAMLCAVNLPAMAT